MSQYPSLVRCPLAVYANTKYNVTCGLRSEESELTKAPQESTGPVDFSFVRSLQRSVCLLRKLASCVFSP